jgi:hypothetical protein
MLQVAFFDSVEKIAGFTGLGGTKDRMGVRDSTVWRADVSQLFKFFPNPSLLTASAIHDTFDTVFTEQLAKPNPQVEILLWLTPDVFPYASFGTSLVTGIHAVALYGRARRDRAQDEVTFLVHSYGQLDNLTVGYGRLRLAMQAMVTVPIKTP